MDLSRWHVVVTLAVALFLVAALAVGGVGRSGAPLDQAAGGKQGASLNAVKDSVTIIGVIIGAASLVFAAMNTRLAATNTDLTRRAGRARFWLDLLDEVAKHRGVSLRLRPEGDWSGAKGAPVTHEEWAQVEYYMGLFEYCEVMLEQELIDEATFKELLGYRLENIVANDTIRCEILVKRADAWERFRALLDRMGIEVKGDDC